MTQIANVKFLGKQGRMATATRGRIISGGSRGISSSGSFGGGGGGGSKGGGGSRGGKK
jgi:hypothetical protein